MSKNKFYLGGRTALVTGAAGLLGYSHCEALLEMDARVVLTDINIDSLNESYEQLLSIFKKENILKLEMDITNSNSIEEAVSNLAENNIFIDILINNASIDPKVDSKKGLLNTSRLENFSLEEWNKQINVGLTGAFLCSKIIGQTMVNNKLKGVILNIASDLSIIAPDQRLYKVDDLDETQQPVKPVTYSVIKSGIIGLTKYLSTYWASNSIRCNALSPGGVYNNQPDSFVKKVSELIPLGRMASKDEYKSAIQFLCSDASSYMNGHNLVMDGGRIVW